MLKIGIIPPVPVFRTYFFALPVVSSQNVSDRVGKEGQPEGRVPLFIFSRFQRRWPQHGVSFFWDGEMFSTPKVGH
jgi:hypothetical protein